MSDLSVDTIKSHKLMHELLKRRPMGLKKIDIDDIFETVDIARTDDGWIRVWFVDGGAHCMFNHGTPIIFCLGEKNIKKVANDVISWLEKTSVTKTTRR